MNAVDPELVGIGHAALADIDGVRPVEELRQRWSGHQLLADVTVEVGSPVDGRVHGGASRRGQPDLLPTVSTAVIHTQPLNTYH